MAREYADIWHLLRNGVEKQYDNSSAVRHNRFLGNNTGCKMSLSGKKDR